MDIWGPSMELSCNVTSLKIVGIKEFKRLKRVLSFLEEAFKSNYVPTMAVSWSLFISVDYESTLTIYHNNQITVSIYYMRKTLKG